MLYPLFGEMYALNQFKAILDDGVNLVNVC